MKHLLIALQFLTSIPVRIRGEIKETDYGRALLFFPLAGSVIGIFLSGIFLISGALPLIVRAVLVVAASVLLTGGLHIDGFADTLDGFYGDRPKDEILRIMRDSRIGVMGAIGINILLMSKFALISNISGQEFFQVMVTVHTVSRFAMAASCMFPYSRPDGKAGIFIRHLKKIDIVLAFVYTFVISVLFMKAKGVMMLLAAIVVSVLFIRYSIKKIGGVTGDVIGAVNEISETVVLFGALV